MRYSKVFGKTKKSVKDYDAVNAKYLIQGGFIDQTMAGVYSYLPLGYRVLGKIEDIIREEMDKVGQEVFLPAIVPTKLWEQTDRIDEVDVLFKTMPANEKSKERNDSEYILNSTHEDTITPVAKKFNVSYRDLPFAVYQIQTKFRNEERPKSGLLRGREFRMKDLYSFHKSEEELKEFYTVAKEAYFKVFERLGIGDETYYVAASGGDFTNDFSHEFQTKCETGEDVIFYDHEADVGYNLEVAPCRAPDIEWDTEMKEMMEVETPGITSVQALAEFLEVPVEKTVKTVLYENDEEDVYAVALRGDYGVNEEKLWDAAEDRSLQLASKETIKAVTGAEVGYAGLLNLPDEVTIMVDDSIENAVNFELGANKTDYHMINVNWERDLEKPDTFYDIKEAKKCDLNPETGNEYEVFVASEVGNIFPLNTKFSKAFDYYYTDENGEKHLVYMGSYGIGSSRVMGVIVEKFHDENGIIWPEQIAPYQVHLLGIGDVEKAVEDVYKIFQNEGIEVLYDDRDDVSTGEKFADADLIGCPYRVVVSEKTLAENAVEVKKRSEETEELVQIDDLITYFT